MVGREIEDVNVDGGGIVISEGRPSCEVVSEWTPCIGRVMEGDDKRVEVGVVDDEEALSTASDDAMMVASLIVITSLFEGIPIIVLAEQTASHKMISLHTGAVFSRIK